MLVKTGYPVSTKTGERVLFKTSASVVFDENGVPVSTRLNNGDLFKHAQEDGYTGTNNDFNNDITNAIVIDEAEDTNVMLSDTEINDDIVSGSLTWSSRKVNNQITNLTSKVNANITKTDRNTTKLTSVDSRLSAALNSSGELAEGDASELHDIRVGYDGTTYTNAGDAVRGQVENVVSQIKEGLSEYFNFDTSLFIRGTHNFFSDGSFNGTVIYRVSSNGILKFNHDLYILCNDGYTTNIGYYNEDGTFTTNMDTAFERVVPANQPFKITIFRTPETDDIKATTANINEFVSAVKLQNYVTKNIEDLKDATFDKMGSFVEDSFRWVDTDFLTGTVRAFSDGGIDPVTYRIYTKPKKKYPYDITITTTEGFQFFVATYNEDGTVSDSGYQTKYTIPANTIFRITILRTTENTAETVSLTEFANAITIKSNFAVLSEKVEELTTRVNEEFTLTDSNGVKYRLVVGTDGVLSTEKIV